MKGESRSRQIVNPIGYTIVVAEFDYWEEVRAFAFLADTLEFVFAASDLIEPDDGTADAFVHISAVQSAGLATLADGQKISYELQPGRDGKSAAGNLSLIE